MFASDGFCATLPLAAAAEVGLIWFAGADGPLTKEQGGPATLREVVKLLADQPLNSENRKLMFTPNANVPEAKAASGRARSIYGYG